MKLTIIGAGALGSLLGFYLSAQAEVWLLDPWQQQVATINRDGLACEHDGTRQTRYPQATSDPAAIGGCDMALVLVKAHQTPWAAAAAAAITPGPALVVTLQNGLGNADVLSARLGTAHVAQGVTSLGATLLGPGLVRHAGSGSTVLSSQPAATAALVALFNTCGLPAEQSDNLDSLVWGKLIVNVGINALTALLRVPNGTLVSEPGIQPLVAAVVAEAVAVAMARGTRLPYADPLAHVLAVAGATAANRSSMLQDVLRGSPSEIATINGAIVREGQRLGVPTPLNTWLTQLVTVIDLTALQRVEP